MRKILTIAAREYRAMVGTKAFLLSVIMMPVLMFGSMLATQMLRKVGETKTLKLVVFDGGNEVFAALQNSAQRHNEFVTNLAGMPTEDDSSIAAGMAGMGRGEFYQLERAAQDVVDDEERLRLSNAIRDGELYGFVELPPGLVDVENPAGVALLYSQDSSIANTRSWLTAELNQIVREKKWSGSFSQNEIERINRASSPVTVSGMGLIEQTIDGQILKATEKNEMADIFLPMGMMMLMFMVIFMSAQPMLESVLEEKSHRIAEVLLGSVSSFQLMLGKLIGTVSGSLTIFAIYTVGIMVVANDRGWVANVPTEILPWFVVFQVFGVLFYASIFMAVGASVSQLKEAQSMLLPVWMLLMMPMFVWLLILHEPLGKLAVWTSLFPPSASTTMVLRMATGQPIPLWEILLSLLLLIMATLMIITLASRIFRVGILWQGKVPKLSEIFRWAIRG